MIIVIIPSKRGRYGRKPRILYGCEFSGKYREHNYHSDRSLKQKRFVGTQKCEYPFDLNGMKSMSTNEHN